MGGMFGKSKIPPVTPPARMPVENDEAMRQAKIAKEEELRSMRGRASTDLEQGGSGKVLGA